MTLVNNPRQLAVLRFIREHSSVTRSEISRATDLSLSQVSRITSQLRDRELITVERLLGGTEGRPTEVLALAQDGRYVIGLDIGGLAQKAVIVNLRGEIVASICVEQSLTVSRSELLSAIVGLVNDVRMRAGIAPDHVLGLGVGLRAVVDPVSGVISGGPEAPAWTPSWIDFPIRDELMKVFQWPQVVVDDTVRALGVAERRYGHGVGEQDFIYLLADTGIGAAIMIGGRPYIGPSRLAGEIGHIELDADGEPCGCGRVGCLETLASSSAVIRRAGKALGDEKLSIEQVIASAEAGAGESWQVLTCGGEALGQGLAVMLNVLAPTLVVLGGSLTASAAYLEAVERVGRGQALGRVGRELRLVRSELGPLAGATGAGTMILDRLFEPGETLVRPRRGRVGAVLAGRE